MESLKGEICMSYLRAYFEPLLETILAVLLARKDGMVSKLKADKEKLEKEVDNLETRLAHLRESLKMVCPMTSVRSAS